MATYKSFNELNGKELKEDDVLMFGDLKYRVHSSFLCSTSISNDAVLKKLGVSPEEFCEAAYGYETEGGEWPESVSYDYEALTRAALLVFCMLEDKDVDSITFLEARITISGLKSKKFKLNGNRVSETIQVGDYKGRIYKDYISVGCQQIPYKTVENILKIARKLGFAK